MVVVDGRLHDRRGGGRVILCQRLVNSLDTDIDSIFDGGMEIFPYCLAHIEYSSTFANPVSAESDV